MRNTCIFKSDRLDFRNWKTADLTEFATLSADSAVMEHFPKPLTEEEPADFIDRL
ncbi:MAG: hypothetical protein WBG42_12585 [Cryomorphaceae bacterium]